LRSLNATDPPGFAQRVHAATRVEPFLGGAVVNYLRQPYGSGWALVGDAGYNNDPITGQGISDAFRDAELCAAALDEAFTGRPYDDVMSAYQRTRDEHVLPMYEFTTQTAKLEPQPPEVQELLDAVQHNQAAMDDFVSVIAGTLSPIEFFDPANIGRIMATSMQPV
jgi:2-polyprenyl-6-methoxyphenol hydroxylase-like FAD-dependent oxidoreductase